MICRHQTRPAATTRSGGRQQSGVVFTLFLAALCTLSMAAQAPKIDTSGIGPRVGQKVPDFIGYRPVRPKAHACSRRSVAKGAMLVFFRSADW